MAGADRLAQAVAKYGKYGTARLLTAAGKVNPGSGKPISERYIRDALTLRPGKTAAAQRQARAGLNTMLGGVDFRHYPKAPKERPGLTAKPKGAMQPTGRLARQGKRGPTYQLVSVGAYDVTDRQGRVVKRIKAELTRAALVRLLAYSGLPASIWRFAYFGEFIPPGAGMYPGALGSLDIPVYGVDADGPEDDTEAGERATHSPTMAESAPRLGWRRGFYGSTLHAAALPQLVAEVDAEVQAAIAEELASQSRRAADGGPKPQSRGSVSHLYHMGRVNRSTGQYIPSWACRLVSKLTGIAWRRCTYTALSLAKGG